MPLGKLKFYFPGRSDTLQFTIKPGSNVKDVEIVLEYQPYIKGRIIYENGEPLTNALVQFDINQLTIDGAARRFYKKHQLPTDADGNFMLTLSSYGIYELSINHRGLTTVSAPCLITHSHYQQNIVLTLNGNSSELATTVNETIEKDIYTRTNIPKFAGMWIINPANGHAYRWILCKNWTDAKKQAEKEKAYIVSINSEEEQIWIETFFNSSPYLIGLSDKKTEGTWEWDSGEPVTYTNWISDDRKRFESEVPFFLKKLGFPDEDQLHDELEDDFAIISDMNWKNEKGKWKVTHLAGPRMVILEKNTITDTD